MQEGDKLPVEGKVIYKLTLINPTDSPENWVFHVETESEYFTAKKLADEMGLLFP